MGRLVRLLAVGAAAATIACCAAPAPAAAFDPAKPICTLAGLVSTLAGKVCDAASHAGRLLGAGKKLLSGHVGGAVGEVMGGASTAAKGLTAMAALDAASGWVTDGARAVLRGTASIISTTTRPDLQSTWFSGFYWRMAGVSALLTLPFLFAAALQALVRSDLTLLLRSAFGYLPLGLIGVSIAAPLTMLLLAGSDEMSQIVTSASGDAEASFLAKTAVLAGAFSVAGHSAFVGLFVGMFTIAAVLALWCELLIRSAAVYVIVLMLPLFFAALVWPARRMWAVRAVELLLALILAKFAIVAVLALGAAGLGHTAIPDVAAMLSGATLVLLAAFSPWALLRMLPLHELAAGAVGGLRAQPLSQPLANPLERASEAEQAQEVAREQRGRLELAAGLAPGSGAEGAPSRPDPDPGVPIPGEATPGAGRGDESGRPAAPPADPSDGTTAAALDDARGGAEDHEPGGASEAARREPTREERRSSLPEMWRSGDGSWRRLVLGEDDDLRPVYDDAPPPPADPPPPSDP